MKSSKKILLVAMVVLCGGGYIVPSQATDLSPGLRQEANACSLTDGVALSQESVTSKSVLPRAGSTVFAWCKAASIQSKNILVGVVRCFAGESRNHVPVEIVEAKSSCEARSIFPLPVWVYQAQQVAKSIKGIKFSAELFFEIFKMYDIAFGDTLSTHEIAENQQHIQESLLCCYEILNNHVLRRLERRDGRCTQKDHERLVALVVQVLKEMNAQGVSVQSSGRLQKNNQQLKKLPGKLTNIIDQAFLRDKKIKV